MTSWVIALLAGLAFALAGYAGRAPGARGPRLASALLRAFAAGAITAILLDAPMSPPRGRPVLVALDASASWRRGGDTSAWRRARAAADSLGTVSLLLGDGVTSGSAPPEATAPRSRVGPLVDRAVADGRAVALVTDGELEDPETLARLPVGSSVHLVRPVAAPDAAVASFEAPSLVVAGDSAELAVTIVAGERGAEKGIVAFRLDETPLAERPIDVLTPFEERTLTVRVALPATAALRVLRATVKTTRDAEARNDTLGRSLEIAARPSAVFVSAAPDADARWVEAALRTSLGAPTRAYWRVAKGVWRDGAFATVDESVVKRAVAEAPLVVLDGDTAYFGAPRAAARGALLLVAPPPASDGEWFPSTAPASPLAAAFGALAFDSLPPLDVADAPALGWTALEAKRARQGPPRRAISGSDSARRVLVVAAAGFARWKRRGGASAEAFDALFGGMVGWLAESSPDARAAVPVGVVLREGTPVRWRRGGRDSMVVVRWVRRGGGGAGTDTLRFSGTVLEASSRALPIGVYDVEVRGGRALLTVNPSAEWVPRRPSAVAGAVGTAAAGDFVPRAREARWLYAVAILLLCAEWLLRRRIGLR